MPTTSQPEVRIIYSASPADRKRVRRAGGRSRTGVSAIGVMICLLNLAVGAGLYYAVWWPIKANVWAVAMLKTPVPMTQDQMDAISAAFGVRPSRRERISEPEPVAPPPSPAITGRAAQSVIWGVVGGWIALMTLACVTLAASAGSIVGGWSGPAAKSFFARLAFLALLALAGGVGYVVWQYGFGFPAWSLRWGGASVMASALLLLAWRAKSGRRATRVCAVLLVLAAVGTAAALYLGHLSGIRPEAIFPESAQATIASLTGTFTQTTALLTITAAAILQLLYAAFLFKTAKRL